MVWIVFEIIIDFLEMLTSCFLAEGLFRKENEKQKNGVMIFCFVVSGTALLVLRAYGFLPVPDFVPALLIFLLYAWLICKTRIWSAALWALLNYLLMGICTIISTSMFSILFGISMEELRAKTVGWVMICVLCRLLQLLYSEVLLSVMRKFRRPGIIYKREISLITISAVSIAVLMLLWNFEIKLSEDFVLYINIFICLLVLFLNFGVLVFKVILSREKFNNEELKEHNRLISMQLRSQSEVAEMYNSIRSLKHDMNNHLHTIQGYMQMKEYEKAEEYIQNITGEIRAMELCQSGNQTIDALIGSKTALARKQGIHVTIDVSVPAKLKMDSKDMVILLGNLYDNAIDANLKIEEYDKRYINIQMLYRDGNLIISFENAAYEKDKSSRDIWLTTKREHFIHGFGIKNIDRIIKQYDGYCQRELKNNVFLCQIRIPA